jgi:hypothetical protein
MHRMWNRPVVMLLAILSAAPTMLLSGQEANAQSAPPSGERRPDFCTEQYAPVCGRVGDNYKIYSNACFARMAGATIVTDRSCPDDQTAPAPK